MLSRSFPAKLSPSYLNGFLSVQHTVSLPPTEAFRKLFARFLVRPAYCLDHSHRSFPQAMLSRSLHGFLSVQHVVSLPPTEAFRKLFARFPLRPACCLAPSQRSSPQALCTVSSPSSMLSCSLPAKLSPSSLHSFLSVQHAVSLSPGEALLKLFPQFPLRPACCLAASHRSFPQAICTVSSPSSMLSCSLPAKLSPSYLHGFLSVQHAVSLHPSEAFRKLFARFLVRPACCLVPPSEAFCKLFAPFPLRPAYCLAPSHRSFPHAICTVSCLSSMLSRSLPAKLSPTYLHNFRFVQHTVSPPLGEALPELFPRFPLRPACCLALSRRSSPQAISTVSSPCSMLSHSLPAKLSASMLSCSLPANLSPSYFHIFLSVQHAVSLPPGEALRKLFPRFPLRPACCLAPSRRSSPQAICTVSCPSSMLSCSLPAKLSASYFHGFQSLKHAVSLPSSEAFRKLFARFPIRPAYCLAPCTVSSPSSMLSRSLPAKFSPSYFHSFLSVQHAVSLPPSQSLRKLFPEFPLRPACCLDPSHRSFPQAISTFSCPLPPKLSASYLHAFLSVQHTVSLPPTEAFRKLFAPFPVRPACCLARSQPRFPQAI